MQILRFLDVKEWEGIKTSEGPNAEHASLFTLN
jgi:hypothetical protein